MKKLIVLILLLLLPDIIFAQDGFDFAPKDTDLSVEYLKMIFGTIEGAFATGGSQVMGAIFKVFNAVVLTIGGFVLMYIMVVSTVNTAHEGEVLGKRWSSIWIPIRAVIGIGLLIPRASGYCTMQSIFMWIILQGIGIADDIWDTAVNYVAAHETLISKEQSISKEDAFDTNLGGVLHAHTGTILRMAACNHAVEKRLNDILDNSPDPDKKVPSFANTMTFAEEVDDSKIIYNFPGEFSGGNSDYNAYKGKCGSITVKNMGTTVNMSRALALNQLYDSLDDIAKSYVYDGDGYEPITGKEDDIAMATIVYYYSLQSIASQLKTVIGSDINDAKFTKMKSQGWITAGAYYYKIAKLGKEEAADTKAIFDPDFSHTTMAQFETSLNSVDVSALPEDNYVVELDSDVGDQKTIGDNVGEGSPANELSYYLRDAKEPKDMFPVETAGDFSSADWQSQAFMYIVGGLMTVFAVGMAFVTGPAWAVIAIATIYPLYKITTGMVELLNSTVGGNVLIGGVFSPIKSLSQVGWGLMDLAITLWTGMAVALAAIALATSAVAAVNPIPYALQVFVTYITPLLTIILTAMIGGGALLVLYIPLIPFLVFFFAVLGWFFQVLEAMVAAPLVALGVIHPEGHEAFGKAESALMLLLNVFLRPAMMVIGFIVASMLTFVGLWLINKMYLEAVLNTIFPISEIDAWLGVSALVIMPVLIILYGVILKQVMEKCFQLITWLPDKILLWIGGAAVMAGSEAAAGAGEATKGMAAGVGKGVAEGGEKMVHASKGALKDAENKSKADAKAGKGEGAAEDTTMQGGGGALQSAEKGPSVEATSGSAGDKKASSGGGKGSDSSAGGGGTSGDSGSDTEKTPSASKPASGDDGES